MDKDSAEKTDLLWVLVPVKQLSLAKSRLSSRFSPAERAVLMINLLTHTLKTVQAAGAQLVVVSPDPRVLALAESLGAITLTENLDAGNTDRLNGAISRAVEQICQLKVVLPKTLLILPADLPLLTEADITTLIELSEESKTVIVPDRAEEGTNGLLLQLAIARIFHYQFGLHSFERHRQTLLEAGIAFTICREPGLGYDLDYPADFDDLPPILKDQLTQPETDFMKPNQNQKSPIINSLTLLLVVMLLTLSLTACGNDTNTRANISTTNATVPAPVNPTTSSVSVNNTSPTPGQIQLTTVPATITKANGETQTMTVELARTGQEQETGLMGRTSLPPDHGMLFIFPQVGIVGFWMKDTLVALSIAFIAQDGTIIDIQDMEAMTETIHQPSQPYLTALEVAKGYFASKGIKPGDKFVYQAPAG